MGPLHPGERVEGIIVSDLAILEKIAVPQPKPVPDLMFFGIPVCIEPLMEPNTIHLQTTQRLLEIKVTHHA